MKLLIGLLLSILPGVAQAQQDVPTIERQKSNTAGTLVLPRQAQTPPPGAQPPVVLQPGQSTLTIPQASRDFIGEWGGYLGVDKVQGDIDAPDEAIVSLAFGEDNGTVFMRTTAFAGRHSMITKTTAQLLDPRRIKLTLEGYELKASPPLKHVESLSIALIGKNKMDCLKYVDFYLPGGGNPVASIDYHGSLRQLTEAELQEMQAEVMRSGSIPQREIEGSRNFGN
ncbi:MAG TPA: hypothetical protein VGI47_10985 [Candidatus Binataceae bacterium]